MRDLIDREKLGPAFSLRTALYLFGGMLLGLAAGFSVHGLATRAGNNPKRPECHNDRSRSRPKDRRPPTADRLFKIIVVRRPPSYC